MVGRVSANDPGNRGCILSWVLPKTQKMVLDASSLNTQLYKVLIKGKWTNPGKGIDPSPHLGVVAIEKGTFGLQLTTVGQHTLSDGLYLSSKFHVFQSLNQYFRDYYYWYHFERFSHQQLLIVFHRSLRSGKSPHISRTLLSILYLS